MLAMLDDLPVLLRDIVRRLGNVDHAFADRQRRFDAVGDPRARRLFDRDAIDDDFDRMARAAIERRHFIDSVSHIVYANTDKAVALDFFKQLFVCLIGVQFNWRQQQ